LCVRDNGALGGPTIYKVRSGGDAETSTRDARSPDFAATRCVEFRARFGEGMDGDPSIPLPVPLALIALNPALARALNPLF